MLTSRAWWFLLISAILLSLGIFLSIGTLVLLGLALMIWFGWEWLIFTIRLRTTLRRIKVQRRVHDDRGPVQTMWTNRTFDVHVSLSLDNELGMAHVLATDFVPFGVVRLRGAPVHSGPLNSGQSLRWMYRVRCVGAGMARFEGVRVQVADLQGFFFYVDFLPTDLEIPILPLLTVNELKSASHKQTNALLPPGVHRLPRPGSGSELLDLRDYRPGDPPKTIAWKVSARRDKLITKEFESEVPVRCTLFLDASDAVRIPALWPGKMPGFENQQRSPHLVHDEDDRTGLASAWVGKPLHRLLEIATGVLQASTRIRDLAGLCLVDEKSATVVKPGRTGRHLDRMLRLLAESTQRTPTDARVDPDLLVPVAHALAQELYPSLMRPPANEMSTFVAWFSSFSMRSRHPASWKRYFYRNKWWLLFIAASIVPMGVYLLNWLLKLLLPGDLQSEIFLASILACGAFFLLTLTVVLFTFLFSFQQRRLASWRKRLAAFLCVRYCLEPGCLDALLEDDDVFSLWLQHFLNEHHAPFALPLYDENGRYRYASKEKVQVLADALVRTTQHARDNELYLLLVDLLEVEDHLEPLLKAIRMAHSRHHQVMVIVPWPPGTPPPETTAPSNEERFRSRTTDAEEPPTTKAKEPLPELASLTVEEAEDMSMEVAARILGENRLHRAYRDLRQRLGKMGVQVLCAAAEQPVNLILERLDQMRMAAGRGRRC